MLVLTRKKGERVLIGDDIVITVIDVRGDGVRIGFDAPRGVPIQRAEVLIAVKEANAGAAASANETGELLVGLLSGARPAPSPAAPADADPAAAEPAPTVPAPAAKPAATPRPARPPRPAPPRPRA